jgi:hypothetical protein
MNRALVLTGLAACALVAAGPAQAAPGDMSAAGFLAKYDALRAKGMAALLSSDAKLLRSEATAAGQAVRAQRLADKAAGRPPTSCPPGKVNLSAQQLVAHLKSYPAEQRPRITLKRAIAEWMTRTYPCRAGAS